MVLGVINFGGPFLVSLFTISLPWIVSTLAVSRVITFFMYKQLALDCLNNANVNAKMGKYSLIVAKQLFNFGGWVTLSSILSPILTQADRFMISSLIAASAVTIYVLPYEMVVQSLILSSAVTSVMFPTLSKLINDGNQNWHRYFLKWLIIVIGLMLISSLTLALILPFILKIWIKTNLHDESILVGQILCMGVFFNSIGAMFYSLLHAQGKASVPAINHLIELPIFIVMLYYAITNYGVIGAAWAWVGRMLIDTALLGVSVKKNWKKPDYLSEVST